MEEHQGRAGFHRIWDLTWDPKERALAALVGHLTSLMSPPEVL